MKIVLEMTDIEKSYGPVEVIRHLNLQLAAGEIYGLLGVNGAGKTTLMKLVLGLQQPDCGRITVLGEEPASDRKFLRNVGCMIEQPQFYEHMTAQELLSMHLSYMKVAGDVEGTLRRVGLADIKKEVSQYSLGMKQRLGLARAIIHRPGLLILDEPLNGMDPVAIVQMRGLLREIAEEGTAVLFSSHILSEVEQTADRIGILSGKTIAETFFISEKKAECGDGFENYIIRQMGGSYEVM